MTYYPMFLRVSDRPVVVIGGGPVAERKVVSLLDAGARVTVVSPSLTATLAELAAAGRIDHHLRAYQAGDLHGARLAFAATNDDTVHGAILAEAEAAGIPLNVVDQPQFCSFIVPAVVQRGDLTIAISTGGASPALAKHIRQDLEDQFGNEYAQAVALLGALRRLLQHDARPAAERQERLTALVESDLIERLRAHDHAGVDQLLRSTAGRDTSAADLGIDLE